MCASELQDGKRYQGCPALYSKPERRGILPVTVRGSATEKADFARKVWWYFKGVFGGIVGIVLQRILFDAIICRIRKIKTSHF